MPSLPFQPVPNVASLTPQFTIPDGDIAENRLNVITTGTWTVDNLTLLANTYITWFQTTTLGVLPLGLVSNAASLFQVTTRDLTTETGLEVSVSPSGGPVSGNQSSPALTNGLSLAIKFLSGIPGRSFRGRAYMIGLTQSALQADANLVTSAYGVGQVTAYKNLFNAIHAANDHWTAVVVSRFSKDLRTIDNPTGRRDSGIATPIINVALTDGFVDYQRRRSPAHSRHL